MSKGRYFVLRELEVPPEEIKEGDVFRCDSSPDMLWKALKNDNAVPVSLVRCYEATEMNLSELPNIYKRLIKPKEKEDGDQRTDG